MQLRPYQQASVTETLAAVEEGERPCLVLPTGAGKSLVLAELCRHYVEHGKRVLMLTHVRELVDQNARELHGYFKELTGKRAPLGIYSAGLKKKQLGHQITYAGVQSIAVRAAELVDAYDVAIVDESHLLPPKGAGRYRQMMAALPNAAWIGLTATPWRLGQGDLATGEGALFTKLLTPPGTTIRELVDAGYLSRLSSKQTDVHLLDLVGEVAKRGGDYVESQLDAAINMSEPNEKIAAEIVHRGQDRKHWLLSCVSVAHCFAMAALLTTMGAPCGVVHGGMSGLEREDTFTRFRTGELRALASVNVLSTGWNFPALDLIAFLRPTESPVIYIQTAGRGARLFPDKTDCMILDFAGLVSTHGPITDVRPPRPPGEKKGAGGAIVKPCPKCAELVLISCMVCTDCGHEWEAVAKKPVLHTDDIMGERRKDGVAGVVSWFWWAHTAKSGKRTLACEYTLDRPTEPLTGADEPSKKVRVATEYLTVWAEGDPGKWAREKVERYASKSGVELIGETKELIERLNAGAPPHTVKLTLKGGYIRVGWHKWAEKTEVKQAAE